MQKKIVKAKFSTLSYDCECCGSFFDEKVDITFGDGHQLTIVSDGHFGDGDWSGQRSDFLLYVGLYHGIKIKEFEQLRFPRLSEELTLQLQDMMQTNATVDEIELNIDYDLASDGNNFAYCASYQSPLLGQHNFGYEYNKGSENKINGWDGSEEQLIEMILTHYIDIIET